MKRIVSAALLLITLFAFTACDQTETPTTEITQETTTAPAVTATATPTIEITQTPTATVTPTLEITKKPIVTNNPNSGTATRPPNWQSVTFPPEVTKADYDFGITYIIDDVDVLCGPNTAEIWKNNDGDSSQLEQAIKAIQNMDFRFSEDYDTSLGFDHMGNAVKEVEQRVNEAIKGYKVHLNAIALGGKFVLLWRSQMCRNHIFNSRR